jgi:hypothetical protein
VIRPSRFAQEFNARTMDLSRSSEGSTIPMRSGDAVGTETFPTWVRQVEADQGDTDDRMTSIDADELGAC